MNSKQWWNTVKNNNVKLNDWLIKQYCGEVTAANRIRSFSDKYASNKNKKILNVIADQEEQHALWVFNLLKNRNIEPDISNAEIRYWRETLPEIESFESGAAVGAHAEGMRLERIKAICEDNESPLDIKEVFTKILDDEIFHEKSFRKMAGDEAMKNTLNAHNRGKKILGLEI